MSRLGIVADPRFLDHDTGNHPEQPARLRAIERRLRESGLWDRARKIHPVPAYREDILRAHDPALFDTIAALAARPPGYAEDYTTFSADTPNAALLASGAAMTAVREIMAGVVDRAFVLSRPPGHHGGRSSATGFCFFNHLAVAARFLDHQYGPLRVAVIDFDAHHGNGTQDIFYDDPAVFYFSVHQDECFPLEGGKSEERGACAAEGTNLNIPVPANTAREEWLAAFESGLEQVFAFRPEFLFLSAGFDAHRLDPLSALRLETEDFSTVTQRILARAKTAPLRGIVSILEGGYHLDALAESVEAHLRVMDSFG